MTLEEQINKGIMEAMKSRDKVRTLALRNVKKNIIEAKTASAAVDSLPDEQVIKIIGKLAKQGADSAQIYRQQGRQDLCDEEMAQVEVLNQYLPVQLSEAELEAALREIIASTGAAGMKDMGKVMGAASKQLAGKAEGRIISAKVKELLS